jgi:hypothetical protein
VAARPAQTGAGLDAALALGLPIGGWCPKGRRAEDGPIPDRYPLVETPEADYDTRTRRNVEDSDGTLILNLGKLDGGTALTAKLAQQIGKPHLVVALEDGIALTTFRAWLEANQIAVLNIAGPRESKRPGVYDAACRCLESLFQSAMKATLHHAVLPAAIPERRPPLFRRLIDAKKLGASPVTLAVFSASAAKGRKQPTPGVFV